MLPGADNAPGDPLEIPPFLRRPQESVMQNNDRPEPELENPDDAKHPVPDEVFKVEEPPTDEEMLATLKKLCAKRDAIVETIRILKKDMDGRVKKL